jgi:hypothetical protein
MLGPAPTHDARVLFDDILRARAGSRAAVQSSVLLADDDLFACTLSLAKAMAQCSVILTLALWNSSRFYVVYRKLLKRHR